MPRTKKQRRERARLARKVDRGITPRSMAQTLDSLEFSTVFRVQGGRRLLGMPAVAIDCNRRRVGKAIVPAILDIGRDKASLLMQKAQEAVTIQARKESLRAKRGNKQVRNVLEAFDSGVLQWVRYDGDTNQQKSLLVGSSDLNQPPLNAGLNQIVCFRGDDNRFYVGEETFDDESAVFVPLSQDGRPITYPSREAAQRSILLACEQGEIERLSDRVVADIHKRMGKKLRLWEKGENANAAFEEYAPELIVSDQYQRITTQSGDLRVRPKDDADFQRTAYVGAKQSLRVTPLVEIQLSQNSADSQ